MKTYFNLWRKNIKINISMRSRYENSIEHTHSKWSTRCNLLHLKSIKIALITVPLFREKISNYDIKLFLFLIYFIHDWVVGINVLQFNIIKHKNTILICYNGGDDWGIINEVPYMTGSIFLSVVFSLSLTT